MSARNATRRPTECAFEDQTASRLRAYIASMRPMRGVADVEGRDEYQRGRSLIERLALSAQGDENPSLKLSPRQCADILHFMHFSEPIEHRDWWDDPARGPSHVVGFYILLQTLESGLRKGGAA